ncbi:DUF6049 family protein, partial [Ornithinimicrobium cerasi]
TEGEPTEGTTGDEEPGGGSTDGSSVTSGPDGAAVTGAGAVPTVAPPAEDADGDGGTSTASPTTPGPGSPPEDPASPTEEPTPPVPVSAEQAVRDGVGELADRLLGLDEEQLWWLPPTDPDLAALLSGAEDDATMRELLGTTPGDPSPTTGSDASDEPGGDGATDMAEGVAELLDRGRTDVAWPLLAGASAGDLERLRSAWPTTGSPLSAVVLPRESVTGSSTAPVSSAVIPLATPSGLDVVATDSRASALFAASAEEEAAHGTGAAVQHLLADTLTAYQQDPDLPRSLVIAPPRGTVITAAVLAELDDGVRDAPWLSPVAAAGSGTGAGAVPPSTLTGAGPDGGQLGEPAAYLDPGVSPLDDAALRSLATLRGHLDGLREVLVGTTAVDSWDRALTQAWSTRWRGEPDAWSESWRPVRAASSQARAALHVNPGTVNFLADQGLMRVTIVNTLPVAVQDVRVRLVSSSSILQIVDQPEPLTIGGDSRATVTFSARAVTRGETTVTAQLTAPNGTSLGDNAPVEVRVQPTGVWIYWVLGGVAGVVLALGLARSLRSTPRAVLAGTHRPGGTTSATSTSTGPA